MASLIELAGSDLVFALIAGGFRVRRREDGLALLVRGHHAVVIPETTRLGRAKILALLASVSVSEDELLSWLAKTRAMSAPGRSGFHRRATIPGHGEHAPERPFQAVIEAARDASRRAAALDGDARAALAASSKTLEQVSIAPRPDSERLRAVQAALDAWNEAFRNHDAPQGRKRRS